MLYVGLTENHKESATAFAQVVGTQVISQLTTLSSIADLAANNESSILLLLIPCFLAMCNI